MTPDPVMAKRGRRGGIATDRKRLSHLSDNEYEVLRELEQLTTSWRSDTTGTPSACAAWLRVVADKLETGEW